jgi:peptidoglycan/xylan/chitin deacetylase (PgdA/CDA1 family)/SAM-dependent methyltransferase
MSGSPEPQTRAATPAKPASTPSWLLPAPIRRLREHLREIRRVAGETQLQVIDAHQQMVESLAGLQDRVARVETLAQQQIAEVSRIGARLEELVAPSPRTPPVERASLPRPQRRRVTRKGQAVVLVYHSIAEPVTDPFELAVAPAEFEEHLRFLSAFGHILSASELSGRLGNGTLTDTYFALTFDDGYANNLHTAKPILDRHGVAATVLIATGSVGGTPFWWDELAEVILQDGKSGEHLTLELDAVARRWNLEERTRQRDYKELWELLRVLGDDSRRQALAAVYSQLGRRPLRTERSLTPEEITDLTEGGLIEVGAHTVTHPVLSRLGDEEACKEIASSKGWLETNLERPVSALSYPYGDYGPREVEIAGRAGFETAFSSLAQAVTVGCDPLQIPRLTVGHQDTSDLEEAIAELFEPSGARAVPAAPPAPGKIDFGSLRRVTPVSREWGFDRGQPVDRYYIERFLARRATAIRGRVLEFADPHYTHKFGGDRVTGSEVLEVTGSAAATYTCRLERGDEIPTERFDCVICTQTLQLIYDLHGALRTLHRILKPGGYLLLTVPGITPIHHGDDYGDAWHWTFTMSSVSRLCGDLFGPDSLEVELFGNVLAASAFLYGLADAELTQDELDHLDPDYPVTIAVQAKK